MDATILTRLNETNCSLLLKHEILKKLVTYMGMAVWNIYKIVTPTFDIYPLEVVWIWQFTFLYLFFTNWGSTVSKTQKRYDPINEPAKTTRTCIWRHCQLQEQQLDYNINVNQTKPPSRNQRLKKITIETTKEKHQSMIITYFVNWK